MTPCKPLQEQEFIRGWFDESNPLWDLLIAYHNLPTTVKSSGLHGITNDPKIKQSTDSKCTDLSLFNRYQQHIADCVNLYCADYPESANNGAFGFQETFNLQHYAPNQGFFKWHSERAQHNPKTIRRHLVFMTYLNTVKDAGYTEFKYQAVRVQPQKGLTLIWPADWTWTHRGVTSTTEHKYIATGWLGFTE
jgi:hypothetical protein